MSMHPEQENFDSLKRLLALKRHEQPPPRYFNEFSRQVVSRIRAGEFDNRESLIEQAQMEAPWVARLLSAFQAKPMYAGVFATAACALLIGGVIFSERSNLPTSDGSSMAGLPTEQHLLPVASSSGGVPFAAWAQKVNDANATNVGGSLFESLQPQGQLAPVNGFNSFRK